MKFLCVLAAVSCTTYSASVPVAPKPAGDVPRGDPVDQAPYTSTGQPRTIDPSQGKTCTMMKGPCPVARCFGGPPAGCAFSSLMTYRADGTCCPEMCVFRQGKTGTGAVCEPVRPTFPPRTTVAPLAPCPMTCKANFKSCEGKYTRDQCIKFAEQGYICGAVKCSADDLFKAKPVCASNMEFQDCGSGCTATCDNPNPMCLAVCVVGCNCPVSMPLWDDASSSCISPERCPAPNTCDNTIAPNYLDSSNTKTQCMDSADGAECRAADCITNQCVPIRSWIEGDKDDRICAEITDRAKCGVDSSVNPYAARCKWAYDGSPPTFVCDGDNWALSQAGSCNVAGTVAAEVCAYLYETDCFAVDKCDATNVLPTCKALVKTTVGSCNLQCRGTTPDKNRDCAQCWLETMFTTRTINDEEPDIESCCGCLDEAFSYAGITKDTLGTILSSACTGDSYGDGYAYDYAYDYTDDDAFDYAYGYDDY